MSSADKVSTGYKLNQTEHHDTGLVVVAGTSGEHTAAAKVVMTIIKLIVVAAQTGGALPGMALGPPFEAKSGARRQDIRDGL